jgi:large subunit ribosomal protein L21
MRFAIVESGGKQYRAVEGSSIEVDRLAIAAGKKLDFERVLLMADGDEVLVGTPTVSDVQVKATVVDHFRGAKVTSFKYAPKKRIRVKGGHRQQYTRLMVEFIGRPGEDRKVERPVSAKSADGVKKPKPAKTASGAARKSAAKKSTGRPAAGKRDSKKK